MDHDGFGPFTQALDPTASGQLNGLMKQISCTIAVVIMDTDPAPVTHMIPLIPVLAEFIAERTGILTITAGTLLNLVRLAANDSPALVPAIIFSALNSMVVGHLATTRTPFLEGNWQDTSYGFRRLQPLVPATAEFEIPANHLNLLSDIFAVDAGHAKTADYVRMWAALGIEATTHFVLVLWAPASPTISPFPASLLPSPLRLLSPAPSSGTSSSQRSQLSLSFSQPSQPASESHSPIPEVPPADFGDALRPDTTFPTACQIVGITAANIQQARRNKKTGLVPMVRNWEAAAHVVAKLCLSVDMQEHQFSGGLKVTLADVLAELGWVVLSYTRKSIWYLWAAEAATLNWAGSVPREGESDFELYMLWKAICFLWKLGGPIRTGNIPSKGSADPEERGAASLTQDILQKGRTKLTALLVQNISEV